MSRFLTALLTFTVLPCPAGWASSQEILPFPEPPSASIAGRLGQMGFHRLRQEHVE